MQSIKWKARESGKAWGRTNQWKVPLNSNISKHNKYSTSNAIYAPWNILWDCLR